MSSESYIDWLEVEFPSGTGGTLRGRLSQPEHSSLPVIVLLTGDGPKGSKSLSWTNLPPILAKEGLRTFLFDFEGLGYSEGSREKLDVLTAAKNLEQAILHLSGSIPVNVKIGCIASSFGATTLLNSPGIANGFDAIGLKSPASFIAEAYALEVDFSELKNWLDTGFSESAGYQSLVITNSLSINTFERASKISVPVMITHGTADEVVPCYQSILLQRVLAGRAELELFEGVGHGYSEPGAWDRMANLLSQWLGKYLN